MTPPVEDYIAFTNLELFYYCNYRGVSQLSYCPGWMAWSMATRVPNKCPDAWKPDRLALSSSRQDTQTCESF